MFLISKISKKNVDIHIIMILIIMYIKHILNHQTNLFGRICDPENTGTAL